MTKNFSYGLIEGSNIDIDSKYWENASDEEKFAEAWRLVELAMELQGKSKDELKFQRSTGSLQRQKY